MEAQNHRGGDLPPLPHGHVCCVIDSGDERARRVAAWADAGLAARERVVVVQSAGEDESLVRSLRDRGVDVLPPEAVYLADGVFDIDRRIEASRAFVEASVAEGYTAVRLASDATTVLDAVGDIDALVAYEKRVDDLCRSAPVSGICFYDRHAFAHTLASFVAAHPCGSADRQLVGRGEPGRVQMSGDIDLSNVDLFEALLTAASDADGLEVDLQAVSFIDVVGATTLAAISRRLGSQRRVRVLSPPRLLGTMLETIGGPDNLDLVSGGAAA